MSERPFSNSTYEEQTHLAERELSSFMAAVKELYEPRRGEPFRERLARRIGTHGQPASLGSPGLACSHNRGFGWISKSSQSSSLSCNVITNS